MATNCPTGAVKAPLYKLPNESCSEGVTIIQTIMTRESLSRSIEGTKMAGGDAARNVTAGETDDDLVYIEAIVNGTKRVCLCDTGCERSLIPPRLVNLDTMEICPIKVCAANRVSDGTLGMSKVTIQIGDDFQVDFNFIVSQHTNIPVLGMDWMAANATGWDFGSGHMSIHGTEVKLQSVASVKSCKKLVSTKKNVIAPWSQVVVEGRVESNNLKRRRNTTWMTQPRLLQGGIMVGCVTVPGNVGLSLVSLVLLNSSNRQVLLKEDLCFAHLELVELCDQVMTCNNNGVEVMRVKVIEPTEEEARPEFIEELMNRGHGDVPEYIMNDLERLNNKYSDIFSRSEFDLGKTPLGLHRIDTGDTCPVRQTLRRQPYDLVLKIDAYVEGMCKAGIIEPSSSPWASNLLVVRKSLLRRLP